MERTDFNQKFQAEKARLNPEQRLAVETTEGPVMVLAGPGTGKTQVLAFRIAEILYKTDSAPRNILALTFTESGVVAMRERLASLIGITAYGVGIYTFHSFANRIINDAGAEFYKSHALDPIDDITQLKLVMQLIDEINHPLLRPVRAPYFYVKPVISAIKSLKNEDVTPSRLKELCDGEITALMNSSESVSKTGKNKGELKQSVRDTVEKLERTKIVAAVFARYQEELTTRGLYDYEDMILFVVKSFHDNPDLLAKYQEQFQYILVDEYQDTNSAQNTLVRLLGNYFENPNIFVVGDDKQSIYRFQGASMTNLLNFKEWYKDSQLISLRENYRSGQIILDNAHALINQNQEQLAKVLPDIETDLRGQEPESEVIFTTYTTDDKEVIGVLSKIKKLLEAEVPASEIAIIYRENSEAAAFADLLTRQGIAFHLEAGSDVLQDDDVRQLLNLLELADDPHNEFALFRFLYASYSGMQALDLVQLSRWRKENRSTWANLMTLEERPETIPPSPWNNLRACYTKVAAWHHYQANHNLGDTVEHIFADSGLLASILQQSDHLDRLHRMRCFFDEIKATMTSVTFATLNDLFERVHIRKTYHLPLVCAPLVERSDAAIRLMTAHKSKGLEFSYVFMPHCLEAKWGRGKKRDLITFPEGIVSHHHEGEEQELEEDRRLFYVGLTRAKKTVYLSYAELDTANKKQLPCQFIAELTQVSMDPAEETGSAVTLVDFFSPVTHHFKETTSQSYLKDIVTKQALTPTGLNTYLTCPLEYLYKYVYCIPGVREAYQAYGTAVHKALELWGTWSKDGSHPYNLEIILSVFTETLIKEGLTEEEVARYKLLGIDVLTAYYKDHALGWIPPLATEYSFTPHSVLLDGTIPITGKLDKIEPIKGSKAVRVVDYKTGRVRSRNEIEGKTASSDGDYKRQLIFYTVLAEADPFFPYTIAEASLAFVDDQKKFSVETFAITKAEREELKELIRSVYGEITALHFEHTPHKRKFEQDESLCDLLRLSVTPPTRIDLPIVSSSELATT